MITNTPTENETMIQLLELRAKIAACHAQERGEPWGVCATLRHKARDLAARFVDPQYMADEQADGPIIQNP
jgi:hypothetical protein